MGKLPLLILLLSVSLTSTLAIRYTNSDSQPLLQQCMQQCKKIPMHQGIREDLHDCVLKCKELFGESESESERWGSGGGSQVDDDDDLLDLMMVKRGSERQYEQCRRDCQREGRRGQGQEWQCQKKCQEKYQWESEGDRRGRRQFDEVDEDDVIKSRFDKLCKQLCHGEGHECVERCIDDMERPHRYFLEEEEFDNQSPRFERCQKRCRGNPYCVAKCVREMRGHFVGDCQEQCHGQGFQCTKRCQQEQGQRYIDDESDNQGRFRECQQQCRGQGYQCQRRCQQQQQQEREQGRTGVRPEQLHECQQRCQRRGQGFECIRICVEESQRGGGGRHGRGMSPQPTLLNSILELVGLF